MAGTLYGTGVGPGDPELITLKAIRKIKQSEVLAFPVSDGGFAEPILEEGEERGFDALLGKCVAYQIVYAALPETERKRKLYLPMPMTRDQARLHAIHDRGVEAMAKILDEGADIAFITLGDPTVYSTFLYIHRRIKRMGYPVELIPGVTSFCAAASRLDTGLVENQEELHVLQGYEGAERGLGLPGTRVLMKVGKRMPQVRQMIRERELEVQMVENCGMKNERIFRGVDEIPDDAGYYSLLIVKEGKK